MRLKWLRLLVPVGALLALAFALSSCGGDDDGGDGAATTAVPEEFAPVTAAPDGAKEGGELTVLAAGDIDYMDPGGAYYQFTYMVTQAAHRNLLSWEPDDVERADAGPRRGGAGDLRGRPDDRVHDPRRGALQPAGGSRGDRGGRRVRDRALDPAGRREPVRRDVRLGDIVGYDEAAKEAADNPTGGAPDIEGVSAPDDRTLRIELVEPPKVAIARVIAQMLSLPVSAPVPEEYAKEFDAKNPSTYGQYVAFTGPYMVENDPETGELTGYTPGKEIKLVRNPNWDPDTDWRPAYLDEITIQEGFTDTASASRKILSGDGQVNGDFPPTPSVQKEAAQETRAGAVPAPELPGYRHIALNTQAPPFDDINVRKAVIANSDREALRNTRGGPLLGPVATHYISPGFPGFEESGGLEGFGLDFLANPNGDPELAAEYMKKAGFESGKCEGSECEISMVGDNIPPGKDTAEVFKGQLEDLGFKVNFRPGGPRDHVHAVLQRSRAAARGLPERRLGPGLQGPTGDARRAVLRAHHRPGEQLQLAAARRAGGQQGNRGGAAGRGRGRARGGVGRRERARQRAGAGRAMDLGELPLVQSTDVAGVVNLHNASWDLNFTSLK